jgi:hypothetical protein
LIKFANFTVQELVAKILEERTIHLYCDFHAHSRKYNMFMYGCENRKRHGPKLVQKTTLVVV